MDIKQVFKSAKDDQPISEINLGEAGPATPIPNTGDDVRWVANGKHYAGNRRVNTRLTEPTIK